MEFGVVLQPNPPASGVVAMMKRAEAAGFGYGWTFDSHVLWQETFVIYPRILAATSTMTVGPMVTNPGTRDWSVIASMFATLNDEYGNRTICGIGRGDSARRYIGQAPVTLATLSDAMTVIKGLAEGREVSTTASRCGSRGCGTGRFRSGWRRTGRRRCGWSASRPTGSSCRRRTRTSPAGRSARSGRRRPTAGRDPASITIAWPPRLRGDRPGHQREQLRWFGGMVGNHVADLVARYGVDGPVPRALTEYIAGRQAYDYSHHGQAGNPSTDFVPDEIVDRFCLLGPASAHIERLRELAEIGADQFALYLMHDDEEDTLDAYGDEIIPALA